MLNRRSPLSLLCLSAAAALMLHAQSEAPPALHHEAEFKQREATLLEAARKNPVGVGEVALDVTPTHKLLLVVRVKTGEGEIHKLWSDDFVMRSGEATMLLGGTLPSPFPYGTGEGEFHSKSIEGPVKEIPLRPGDTLHIPPNVAHWLKLKPGATVTYLVFKAKE